MINKKLSYIILLFSLISYRVCQATSSLPTVSPTINNPTGYGDLADFPRALVDIMQPLAGIIFVVTILVGGIQYMTASGNEENVGKARRILLWGTIGAIVVFTAKLLINYLIG